MNPSTLRDLLARAIVADTHAELRQCVIDCVTALVSLAEELGPVDLRSERVRNAILRFERDRKR